MLCTFDDVAHKCSAMTDSWCAAAFATLAWLNESQDRCCVVTVDHHASE